MTAIEAISSSRVSQLLRGIQRSRESVRKNHIDIDNRRTAGGFSSATGDWAVLGESKWDGQTWIHSCGTPLSRTPLTLTRLLGNGSYLHTEEAAKRLVYVSYCSKCEKPPSGGTFSYIGKNHTELVLIE